MGRRGGKGFFTGLVAVCVLLAAGAAFAADDEIKIGACQPITGRFAFNPCAIAGPMSAGFSTRIPTAPMSSAMRAKLTLLKVHISRACSVWVPP